MMEEHPNHPAFTNPWSEAKWTMMVNRIEPYVIFETKFERGCVALESPDVDGDFDGCTLGGEVLSFNVADVIKVGRDCFR